MLLYIQDFYLINHYNYYVAVSSSDSLSSSRCSASSPQKHVVFSPIQTVADACLKQPFFTIESEILSQEILYLNGYSCLLPFIQHCLMPSMLSTTS